MDFARRHSLRAARQRHDLCHDRYRRRATFVGAAPRAVSLELRARLFAPAVGLAPLARRGLAGARTDSLAGDVGGRYGADLAPPPRPSARAVRRRMGLSRGTRATATAGRAADGLLFVDLAR